MAKEKTTHADLPPPTSHSAVESIVGALSELEDDIDGLYSRVEEMKKRIMAHSNEEIDKLKQQIIALANEEAKRVVDSARAEAEKESREIESQAKKSHEGIKKNIDSSFDRAVDSIVKTVLGDTSSQASPKSAKTKKYTSDDKPASSS